MLTAVIQISLFSYPFCICLTWQAIHISEWKILVLSVSNIHMSLYVFVLEISCKYFEDILESILQMFCRYFENILQFIADILEIICRYVGNTLIGRRAVRGRATCQRPCQQASKSSACRQLSDLLYFANLLI